MQNGLNLDAFVDALAEKVADRVGARLAQANNGTTIKPRLLSIEQAGQYLSRSAHSVRHLITAGKLPVVKLDNRIFLDVRDLDRVIDESKQVAL